MELRETSRGALTTADREDVSNIRPRNVVQRNLKDLRKYWIWWRPTAALFKWDFFLFSQSLLNRKVSDHFTHESWIIIISYDSLTFSQKVPQWRLHRLDDKERDVLHGIRVRDEERRQRRILRTGLWCLLHLWVAPMSKHIVCKRSFLTSRDLHSISWV